jgi:putative replication initiation protein|nr:MAG TPA: replisome organizer protein [Caudoviricetes sp.]
MPLKIDDYKDFEMFYKLPQELFDECFKGLSIGAKVLYAILRDKWGQSQKNGWHDEKGIYCNFSVKLLSELMGCSERSIIVYKKELNDYHLISESRQFNSTNKIYVNRVSEAKRNVHVNNSCTEVQNLHHTNAEFACTEVQNLPTNQTNINQTNLTRLNDNDDTVQKLENIQSGTIAQTLRSRGFKLDQIQFQQLFDYIALDGMKIELVQLAISKSADNEARNFRYLKSILDNWKKNGVTTVEEAEQADEKYKSSKKPKTYNGQKDFKSGKYALLGTDISVHEIDPELGF